MSNDSKGTCPLGGLWYTCEEQSPTFFGCCTSNPCNGSGCPASDLRAAGMGTGSGPDFSTNDGSYWPNVQCAHGQWWTCAEQTPSFQGCCISKPCAGVGCAMGNLFPAAFGTVTSAAPSSSTLTSIASTLSSSKTLVSSSTLLSTTTTQSADSASTPSSSISSSGATHSPSPNVAAIAGGAAGGGVGGILLLLVVVFGVMKCRRRKTSVSTPDSDLPGLPSNPKFAPQGQGQPIYNDEAYYPGQPIFGVPGAAKYEALTPNTPTSPVPPAYYSPQRSPNRNTYEIDSTALHEVDGGQVLDSPRL